MSLNLIVGMTKSRVIGKANGLPWHIPDDLKNFKKITDNSVVVMGFRTYLSLGRPLPNRVNIVISDRPQPIDGVVVCNSFLDALDKARSFGKEIFIIGGASVYGQALPFVDKMFISFMKKEYEGDVYFPEFDLNEWESIQKIDFPDFEFVVFQRKNGQSEKI